METDSERFGFLTQSDIKYYFHSATGTPIEYKSRWDFNIEHFLETEHLSA
jgi:hypothetical protein